MLTSMLFSRHFKKRRAEEQGSKKLSTVLSNLSQDNEYEGDLKEEFVALTAKQAGELRMSLRKTDLLISPLKLLLVQLLVGVLMAWVTWLLDGRASVAYSVLYGVFAVVLPTAVSIRLSATVKMLANAGSVLMGLFVLEFIKVALTIAILLAAQKVMPQLSWLAMLLSFIVTMKVSWVVMWLHLVGSSKIIKN